jgi:hypothetical protein
MCVRVRVHTRVSSGLELAQEGDHAYFIRIYKCPSIQPGNTLLIDKRLTQQCVLIGPTNPSLYRFEILSGEGYDVLFEIPSEGDSFARCVRYILSELISEIPGTATVPRFTDLADRDVVDMEQGFSRSAASILPLLENCLALVEPASNFLDNRQNNSARADRGINSSDEEAGGLSMAFVERTIIFSAAAILQTGDSGLDLDWQSERSFNNYIFYCYNFLHKNVTSRVKLCIWYNFSA